MRVRPNANPLRLRTVGWFWIDDSELQSRRVFLPLMNIFSMADTSHESSAPVLTIPAHSAACVQLLSN
jgi:hypothetical protein